MDSIIKKPAWPLYLLLFTSVDTVLFGTNSNKLFLYVPRIIDALAIILLPVLIRKALVLKINFRTNVFPLFMTMIMVVSGLYNNQPFETFISRCIFLLTGYIISVSYTQQEFFQIFDNFINFVSKIAIIVEIISYVAPSIIMKLPIITNTAGLSFYTFFFGCQAEFNINEPLKRALGIFWEPGAYAIYLVIAIMIQLFCLDKTNYKRVLLYTACVFLTFSTTGFLSLGALYIVFVLSNRSDAISNKAKKWVLVFALLVFILTALGNFSFINEKVFDKITNGTSGATTRYSSIFNGMRVALDHPLLGVCNDSHEYMQEYVFAQDSKFNNGGLTITNTIVGQFVCYGSIFGMMFVIGTYQFIKKNSAGFKERLLLFIVFAMLYSGERFFSFFPFIFVFYGFNIWRNDYENNRNKLTSKWKPCNDNEGNRRSVRGKAGG